MNQCLVTLTIVSIAIFVHFVTQWQNLDTRENVDIIILVLSGRYLFDQRTAIRNSWMKTANPKQTKIFFVVGDTDCPIPFHLRISQYSCEDIDVNRNYDEPIMAHKIVNSTEKCNDVSRGFSFYVSSVQNFVDKFSSIIFEGIRLRVFDWNWPSLWLW